MSDEMTVPKTFYTRDISRPIRLADVLLAIPKSEPLTLFPERLIFGEVNEKGAFGIWNLRKDDLNEQSEETIDFLAGLLS